MNAIKFLEKYLNNQNTLSSEMKEMIQTASFRANLYKEIDLNFQNEYHLLLLELLKEEMIYRAKDDENEDDEYFESIYWCSLFLYEIGDVNDVNILWKAKNIDFDTYCAFDIQFLIGAGLERTIEHLNSKKDKDSKKALEYILDCKDAGDFSYMEKWFEFRVNYFRSE